MGKIFVIGSASLCVLFGYVCLGVWKTLYSVPPRPKAADESPWWGPGQETNEKVIVNKFTINISDSIIQDLRRRLENSVELHPPLEGVHQEYGLNTNYLKKIVNHWLNQYNWSERQKLLNEYPQFTIKVQGLNIHYLHVKPKNTEGVKVLPLLLLHGWPSSTRELFDMIDLLTTKQKGKKVVFEVVAPNLPGFTFSEASVRPGMNPMQIAIIMKNLMKHLDYQKYYVQGGDWGGHVVQLIATLFPEKVIGLHSNFCFVNTPLAHLKVFLGGFFPSLVIQDKVRDKVYPMMDKIKYLFKETGYMHIQATKPDTLGVALTDSPIGLAAYLLEKFSQFTDPQNEFREDGGLEKLFKLDDLLDNVMMYWVTRSITSSMRIYAENFSKYYLAMNVLSISTNVPTACARFSNELVYQPEWVLKDKFTNLIQVTDLEGGHFAPLEVPHTIAEDIFKFAEKVEFSLH